MHSSLETTIEYQAQKIITVQGLNNLINIINNIKAAESQLHVIISAYTTNNESLLRELDAFISKAKGDNNGIKLVNCLDIEFIPFNSLVDDLIKHVRENIKDTRWSTTTMMFNIYLKVTSYVFRENEILQFAVRLKGNVSQTNVTEDLIYLRNNRNNTIEKFLESVRKVGHKLNANDSVQVLNLKTLSDDKIVRMKNFLQLFYEKEEVLSNEGTCTRTCGDYSNIAHHRNGCFGTARDCEYVTGWYYKILTYKKPQVDRIYTKIDEIHKRYAESTIEIGPNQVRRSHLLHIRIFY